MKNLMLIFLCIKLLSVQDIKANEPVCVPIVRDSTRKIYSYYYDSPKHFYPTRINVSGDGFYESKVFIYPSDYASGSGFIDSLKAGRFIAYPIEELGCSNFILSGSITKYYPYKKGLKESELSLETNESIPFSAFKFSNKSDLGSMPGTGTESVFAPDSRYKTRITYDDYDSRGNLLQSKITEGVYSCYLWGYNNLYPIAEIINAVSGDVAYTSFEPASKGNWTFSGNAVADGTSPTGQQCYLLTSGALIKGGLNSDKAYQLSYWKKSGAAVTVSGATITKTVTGRTFQGWTFIIHNLTTTGTVTVSGNGYIDEVRLHPREAQMTTSTYMPMTGITSQADTRGNIVYYEYDGMQRLKCEKDQNKNIVKSYDYHYKTEN